MLSPLQCTRQALSEKLGRGSRTVDLDLEPRLELLRDDRQRYETVTKLAQTLASQLEQFTVTQKTLGDAFSDLSVKTPVLHVSPSTKMNVSVCGELRSCLAKYTFH